MAMQTHTIDSPRIAVVIPCYRVKRFIAQVIASVPPGVEKIYVVDDVCPEGSADAALAAGDGRVEVLRNPVNLGVGGAVIAGYRRALAEGFSIIVKLDGDGQMDGAQIGNFVSPIAGGAADYTKGNRFYHPGALHEMPPARLLANVVLSFITKLSSGYWNSFDPANGYTAISAEVLRQLPLDKIHPRYFFESDMLFRLNTLRAVLVDVPMVAKYGEEKSNVSMVQNIVPFAAGTCRNFLKRIVYNYYLRNFSLASLQLLFGLALTAFGLFYGFSHWLMSEATQQPATAGTVMLAALPVIVGFQLLMSFLNYDINAVPRQPITPFLRNL